MCKQLILVWTAIRDSINEQKKRWEVANPPSIEVQFIKSEFLKENPKYQSINQRREEELKEARKRMGLNEDPIDIKETSKDPSL